MMATPALQLVCCPACGAECLAEQPRYCWLCGAAVQPAGVPTLLGPAPIDARVSATFGLSTLVLVVALAAVLFGVFREAPGLAILLAVAVTPAFVTVAIVGARRRARGLETTFWHRFGLFALVSVATVFLIGLAGAIFLLALCVSLLSGR